MWGGGEDEDVLFVSLCYTSRNLCSCKLMAADDLMVGVTAINQRFLSWQGRLQEFFGGRSSTHKYRAVYLKAACTHLSVYKWKN